ncbi:MAG: hypothetical protein QOD88_782, partial [Mycobacterium sp.]|nr:hypothetical protein [Mycobacterium sp.]
VLESRSSAENLWQRKLALRWDIGCEVGRNVFVGALAVSGR